MSPRKIVNLCVVLFLVAYIAGMRAFAGETVNVTLYDVVLYPPNGGAVVHFKTMDECVAAAPVAAAPGAKSRCHIINYVTKVGVCDSPQPPWPVTVDADGFLSSPELRIPVLANGDWGPTEIQAMVPAPWPECWVKGWVKYTGQDMQPDPDRVAYVENPADLRPEPLKCDAPGADLGNCIDPEACIDTRENLDKVPPVLCPGPGEGPKGAVTVDKPG